MDALQKTGIGKHENAGDQRIAGNEWKPTPLIPACAGITTFIRFP